MADIAGARGVVDDVKAVLAAVGRFEARNKCEAQLLDANLVCGVDHLRSAVEHAERAFARGTNVAKRRTVEILRYAAGVRQIDAALEKMGLKAGLDAVAVVVLGGAEANDLIDALGWTRDDDVLVATEEKLARFGIGEAERRAVPPERRPDLVLERVAHVDLLR
jgi:KEOPS complex subunit Cgi121